MTLSDSDELKKPFTLQIPFILPKSSTPPSLTITFLILKYIKDDL